MMTEEEKKRKELVHRVKKEIVKNYKRLEESMVSQLCMLTSNHNLTTGTYKEAIWMELFRNMIPHKFCIAQGVFIIDSYEGISNEVDLAVYDEMYTPYIFHYGKITFIPIEAVAVAVQCKSKEIGKKNVTEWSERIKELKPSVNSILRIISGVVENCSVSRNKEGGANKISQTATRPVLILCRAYEKDEAKKPAAISKSIQEAYDIILEADGEHLKKTILHLSDDYTYWYRELCHYRLDRYEGEHLKDGHLQLKDIMKEQSINRGLEELEITDGTEENVLMSLTLQLNQLLMILNNPMAFPHAAYAGCFNKILGNSESEKEE